MSEFWVKKMKNYFRVHDLDGDGILTKRDYEIMGERLCEKRTLDSAQQERIRKSTSNIWQSFSKLAGTKKDLVTELVFIESIKTQRNDEEFKDNLEEFCNSFIEAFDTNEDGFLQGDEHRRFSEILGLAMAASDAKAAFDAIDTNHDGKLSKEEFTAAYIDFFLNEDVNSPFQFFLGPLE